MAARKRLKISREEWEHFRKLTLMDDDFMNLALEGNIPCVEEMLRVILKKEDLSVRKVQTQKFLKGFARSVYLDVFAVDSEGTLYNIEIQQENEGADPRRPRFHGAMLDTHALKAGQDFRELPERYVIFITRNDVLGVGQTTGLTRRVSVAASGWSAVSERSAGRFVKAWPNGLRHPPVHRGRGQTPAL